MDVHVRRARWSYAVPGPARATQCNRTALQLTERHYRGRTEHTSPPPLVTQPNRKKVWPRPSQCMVAALCGPVTTLDMETSLLVQLRLPVLGRLCAVSATRTRAPTRGSAIPSKHRCTSLPVPTDFSEASIPNIPCSPSLSVSYAPGLLP